jgi:hypothetical protein
MIQQNKPILQIWKKNHLGEKTKMSFMYALEKQLNTTETDNGAKAYKSTLDFNVDLFGKISAARENPDAITGLYLKALEEDPETALRILFNCRDIRGGQGERKVFRHLLLNTPYEIRMAIIPLVPIYGRWDDLFVLNGCLDWKRVVDFIVSKLNADNDPEVIKPSLLAKWMPSINSSSKATKALGRQFAKAMNLSEKEYRQMLSKIRKKIDLVEHKMCSQAWGDIDYSKIPSRAGLMYRKSFIKHDLERYNNFMLSAMKLENKVNASTLYPYDIAEKFGLGQFFTTNLDPTEELALEVMWQNLPDYMEGKTFNGLVVADTSGSMFGRPISVSVSLAMYIAERNSGVWKNKFITFSESPEIQTIVGETIGQKIRNLSKADWGYNTNLIAVFKSILKAAKADNVAPSDMPEKIFIVSDMQFDQACQSNNKTNFEQIKKNYAKYGYTVPQLVFWNVNGTSNVPITIHDTGTCLVSGCSPSILKAVLKGDIISAKDIMMNAVYTERYDLVSKAITILQ